MDLLLPANASGGVCGQDHVCDPRADLDTDNMVDVSDLLILAAN